MIVPVALFASLISVAVAVPINKIVQGHPAAEGQFPFMVLVKVNDYGICGGSIINERFVLTAAHCTVDDPDDQMSVEVGSIYRDQGTRYPVEWTKAHPDYETKFYSNDISIIKLKKEIQFNDLVQPIPLNNRDVYNFHDGTIMGFGVEKLNGTVSEYLKFLDVSVGSREYCNLMLGHSKEVDVCVKTPKGDGACSGDSGSPFVSEGVQIGVASRIYPPCGAWKDVYARVDVHYDWIYSYVY